MFVFLIKSILVYIFFYRSVSEEGTELDEASAVQGMDSLNVSCLLVNLIL